MVSTIWALYLHSFLHSTSSVGFLTSLFTVIEVLAYLFMIPLIEKGNKVKMLISSLVFFVISYAIFSAFSSIYLVIGIGLLISIFTSLNINVFGIIVRDETEDSRVSKNEGIIFTLWNIAWLLGPLAAGYIAKVQGFKGVFFIAAGLILASIFAFDFFKIKDKRVSKKIDKNVLKVLLSFFSKKERLIVYLLNMAVGFWWMFIYVYMPIYIVENGQSDLFVGIFLAAVTVPLILFEYVFGKFAGDNGFKRLFFIGFAVLGVFAISCFFISNIYIIGVLLVFASLGVAMIEPNTEAYFMDVVKENQRDKYYGPYATATTIGGFLGSLPAAILLLVLPFRSLFLYFGLPMILLAFLALKIKDSYEFKKR